MSTPSHKFLLLLPLTFSVSSAVFWFVFLKIFGCQGLQKGPWTIEAISQIKQTEHLIYWLSVLGIPICSVVLAQMVKELVAYLRGQQKGGTEPEAAEVVTEALHQSIRVVHHPSGNTYLRAKFFLFWIALPIMLYVVAPRTIAKTPIRTMDEGLRLSAAHHAMNNKEIYRDIFLNYGPLLEIVQSRLAFQLFGESLAAHRKMQWVVEPLGFVAAYFLALISIKRRIFVFFFLYLILGDVWIPHRMALPMLALCCICLAWSNRGKRHSKIVLVTCGIICSMAYLYSMEGGIFVGASLFCFYLVCCLWEWRLVKGKGTCWREARFILAGVGIISVPFVIWMASTGRLGIVFSDTFHMGKIVLPAYAKPTPVLCSVLTDFVRNPFLYFSKVQGVWIRWWFPLLLYMGIFTWALGLLWMKRSYKAVRIPFLLTLCSVFFFLVAMMRTDYEHWLNAVPLFWILIVLLMDRGVTFFINNAKANFLMTPVGVLEIGGSCILILFMAGYVLNTSRISSVLSRFRSPVAFPASNAKTKASVLPRLGPIDIPKMQLASVLGIVDRIHKYVQPGEYVYCFSNEPIYYFLADVINPTRYSLSEFIIGENLINEVRGELNKKKPKLILAKASGDGIYRKYYQKPLSDYILDRYRVAERFSGYVFLTQKASGEENNLAPTGFEP